MKPKSYAHLRAQDCEPVAPPPSVSFALAPPSVARSFASAIGSPVHDPAKWPAYSVSQFSDSKVWRALTTA